MKWVIIVVVIGGLCIGIAFITNEGELLRNKETAARRAAVIASPEYEERENCITYAKALVSRASECSKKGFKLKPHWWARAADGTPGQVNACLISDFSWKRTAENTAVCVGIFQAIECKTFDKAKWLDSIFCR